MIFRYISFLDAPHSTVPDHDAHVSIVSMFACTPLFCPLQESEEDEGDRTLTEEASDEEQQGTGISLPGYHLPTPARGVAKPDMPSNRAPQASQLQGPTQLSEQGQVPWENRCDELAEDLRTRDILQNRAKYW